jgi:hypothetical protein
MAVPDLIYSAMPFVDMANTALSIKSLSEKSDSEQDLVNDAKLSTEDNLSQLHKKLSDEKVAQSYDCMEGVYGDNPIKQNTTQTDKQINFIRDEIPKYGLTLASIMHIVSGLTRGANLLPDAVSEFLHKNSTRLSKTFNFVNYTVKGLDALKHKRSWDSLGRLAYSVIVPFQDQEDLFLSSGISSGITMFEQGQRHKVPNGDKPKSFSENFMHNIDAFKKMASEIFNGGLWGPNRKVFVHEDKEEGHTMFLGAMGNFAGAVLGMLSGKGKSVTKQFATLIRNAGGIVCDWGKIMSPDWNNKVSGITYLIVSVLDVAQSLAPEPLASRVSHISLAINNLANYFYVNTSKATSDGNYKEFKGNKNNKSQDQFFVNLARTNPNMSEIIAKSKISTAA